MVETNSNPPVDGLRQQAAQFLKAQAEDGWRNWAWGEDSHLERLYAAYPELFTQASLEAVRAAAGDDARLRMFAGYLEREWIGRQTAALQDRIVNQEAAAEVELEGERFPFRQLSAHLSNEPDRARRRRLYEAGDAVYERLNPLRREGLELAHRLARELGYTGYIALAERQKSLHLEGLRGVCARWLQSTEGLYEELLEAQLRGELQQGRQDFHRADTARLLRSPGFDRLFPRERMRPLLEETLRGLGIELNQQSNILLDTEDRARKAPRAVMFPIDAPSDIRISIRPVGGGDDYAALFHEMGHAQHFAHITETAWEYRNVGSSNAVTEVFAFLFEHLLDDAGWLRRYLGVEGEAARAFLRSRAFRRLFMLRRYCAKLEYESRLHAGAEPAAALYSDLLSGALGYRREESEELRYLADVDELFYSADYLRAWFVEAQLVRRLRREYGAEWFGRPQAGGELGRLWSTGLKEGPEEFAERAGVGKVEARALEEEIRELAGHA